MYGTWYIPYQYQKTKDRTKNGKHELYLKLRGIHVEAWNLNGFNSRHKTIFFIKHINKHLPKDDERRETNKCGPL